VINNDARIKQGQKPDMNVSVRPQITNLATMRNFEVTFHKLNNNGIPWRCYAMLFGVLYPTFRRTVVTSSSVPENRLALSMTALRPFAVSGTIYTTTQGNIPEDLKLQQYRR
jgi:hypothetical protein